MKIYAFVDNGFILFSIRTTSLDAAVAAFAEECPVDYSCGFYDIEVYTP